MAATWMVLVGCGFETLSGGGGIAASDAVEVLGSNGEAPEDERGAFFAEGGIHTFHLSIPEEGRARLAADPFSAVPATFTADAAAQPVLLRLKGTTTFRSLSGKAAFKIDFRAVDPRARFHGLKRLTLNSMVQDSSMLHEHLAYWLFRHRGLPAPRHTYARVHVDGVAYGLYGVVETMDEQLLEHALPDDAEGNLYEANLADFSVKDANKYQIEESGGLFAPGADLEALCASLEESAPGDWVDTLARGFELDSLFAFLAIDLVSGNVDGYSRLRNNYLAYHGVEGWRLLPWGFDQSFQWHRSVNNFGEFPGLLAGHCKDSPECSELLFSAVDDLMGVWQEGTFVAMASAAADLIQADCRADPRSELLCDVGHVVPFLLDRPARVADDLEEWP